MKFYRVRPEQDQFPRFKRSKKYVFVPNGMYIRNELFTEKELSKDYFLSTRSKIFEEVEISKMKTFWCFGARFEIKEV